MLTLIAFLSFNIWAQTSQVCNFEVKCENFRLTFKSASGECVEDDTKISFTRLPEGTATTIPVKEAWFIETANVGNVPSTCSSTSYPQFPAFDVGSYKLIFLRQDARPGFNLIQALVIDPKTGKVIDQLELGRYMRDTLGILKTPRGYKLRMVKGFLKEMNCDCDAGIEEAWMEVSFKKNKILKRWP